MPQYLAHAGARDSALGALSREPEPSPGPLPVHLLGPLARSFSQDHYVADTGDVVFYQKDPNFW